MSVADWQEAAFFWAFGAAAAFPLVYSRVARWWDRWVGWTMVSLDLAFLIALGPSFLHYTLGVTLSTWYAWYHVGSLALSGTVVAWRTWTVWWVQRQNRRGQ